MSLQNFYFWNLKDCCCFCFLGLWGKGDLSRAEKLLYFVGCAVEEKWHTSSLRHVFTRLVKLKKKKEKNGEMFHVSCLFLPKAKRRAKESWDRYSDIPREDVAGMKACHFVTDDHETAPFFFFSIFFFLNQTLSEFEGYIVSVLPYRSKQEWNFETGCLQASQMCPFDKWQEVEELDWKVYNQPQPTVFTTVLTEKGITNWSCDSR